MKRIVSVSDSLDAFAQFSRYRAETLQVGRGRPRTGRGWVKIVGVLLGGGGWSGRAGRDGLVGTGRGGVKIVRVLLRGDAGGRGGGQGQGGGWAVVKARATPGNPASY